MAFIFKPHHMRAVVAHVRPICREMSRSSGSGGGGRSNKLRGIKGRRSAIDMVDALDISTHDTGSQSARTGSKLKRNLTKQEEKVLDIASQGSLDATSEEVRDVLNEYIESNKFSYAFKGFRNASDLVEIVDVKCNHDYSNAVALWKASSMELLVKSMEVQHGEQKATDLAAKIVNTINKVFREKEGAMRTNLMRKMDFKRVPKVQYRPKDPSMGINVVEDMINPLFMRQHFVGDFVEEGSEGLDLEEEYHAATKTSRRAQPTHSADEYEGREGDSDYDTDEYSDEYNSEDEEEYVNEEEEEYEEYEEYVPEELLPAKKRR